ncbi:MAG TPA: CHAT domain-containing protein, partial [Acidimicrobiales bacterium]
DGEARHHVLGPEARVRAEVDALRFAMNRRARSARSGRGSDGLRAALVPTVDAGATRLDELVLGPLRGVIGDRSLVVVPTGCLHAVPWGALPSCRGRSVSVCPSATRWLEGDAAASTAVAVAVASGGGPAVLVAGAGITDGSAEVERITPFYPGSVVLQGAGATIARVLAEVEGADVVHVAAHGCFRWEKPLFSSVELSDGRLTVYDLERVGRAPRRVVLSSCETGLSGPDVLGIPSALLTLGTEALIASVVVVSGAEVQDLVVELHRHLSAGARAPDALARAQESVRGTDAFWAGLGFVCLGA